MEAGEYARLLRQRWRLLLLLTALCGVGAWVSLSFATPTFRQTLHFVLHPDSSFDLADVPNAIDVLGEDSPLTQTVLGALASRRVFGRAVDAATTDAVAADYTLEVSVAPGSNLIDATVRGPNRANVSAVARALAPEAFAYVAGTYPGYVLTLLGTEAAPVPARSGELNLVGLAAMFGGLLGAAVIFAEGALRSRRQSRSRRRAKPRGRKAPPRKPRKPAARRADAAPVPDSIPESVLRDDDGSNDATTQPSKTALRGGPAPTRRPTKRESAEKKGRPPREAALDGVPPGPAHD